MEIENTENKAGSPYSLIHEGGNKSGTSTCFGKTVESAKENKWRIAIVANIVLSLSCLALTIYAICSFDNTTVMEHNIGDYSDRLFDINIAQQERIIALEQQIAYLVNQTLEVSNSTDLTDGASSMDATSALTSVYKSVSLPSAGSLGSLQILPSIVEGLNNQREDGLDGAETWKAERASAEKLHTKTSVTSGTGVDTSPTSRSTTHKMQSWYGRYCGPGTSCGDLSKTPVDKVDATCQAHDKCYCQHGDYACGCDRAHQIALKNMLFTKLSASQRAFVVGAIASYFPQRPCKTFNQVCAPKISCSMKGWKLKCSTSQVCAKVTIQIPYGTYIGNGFN